MQKISCRNHTEQWGLTADDMEKVRVLNHDYIILKSFRNTIVTPHVAFFTDQAVSDMVESSIKSVVQFAAGEDSPLEVHAPR
ncbi:MAG: hypothetical protein ACI4AA_07400 [Lachnospiraceae bacterium]